MMKNMTKSIKTIASISLLILTFNSQASELTIPNQFTSGARAVAADVNANFDATAISVNDNQTQLTDLIAQITALTATVTSLQAEVESLQADSVAGLSGVLSVGTDNQGNTAAIFSGVNLHVNNGLGNTNSVNGLGNFIVGYDEVTISSDQICSSGVFTDQASCEGADKVWSNSHKSGSHNLIVGTQHNYSRAGGFIAGRENSVNGTWGSAYGGTGNLASGLGVSVTGSRNVASGQASSISGGIANLASGVSSSVSGGFENEASGDSSSVNGGASNIASGGSSNVSGGFNNIASGSVSSVSGGLNNIASGVYSNVSGGSNREATGTEDWVAGTLFEDN